MKQELASLTRGYTIAAALWTLFASASLYIGISTEQHHEIITAKTEATTHLNKDKAFRLWASEHGGVYVPVDERTRPNPHLAHIPERDIQTPSGKLLTLMNPAYMLHQMMDDYQSIFHIKGKVTTFPDKLFNPENHPDAWELAGLHALAGGKKEVFEIDEVNGTSHMRMMRPMFMTADCMKCHASQGYQPGDFRGAISVAVPMTSYAEHARMSYIWLSASHSLIWLFGLTGGIYSYRTIRRRIIIRAKLEGQLRRVNAKLKAYSYQDGLTRIPNRRMFDAFLKKEWASAMRHSRPLSLIMIDIDHFKNYNDGYGHHAGDLCLNQVAASLHAVSKRGNDLVARFGGEEFAILLPDTDISQAARLARRCHKSIATLNIPHEYSEAGESVSISVGVATMIPAAKQQMSDLINAADRALYQAKSGGRNRIQLSTEIIST